MTPDDQRPAFLSDVRAVEEALDRHEQHLLTDAEFRQLVLERFARSDSRARFWRAVAIPSISGVFLLLMGASARVILP